MIEKFDHKFEQIIGIYKYFSPTEMSTYRQLTVNLIDLINDEETFQLFTLVLLLSDLYNSGQLKLLQIVQNCPHQIKVGPM